MATHAVQKMCEAEALQTVEEEIFMGAFKGTPPMPPAPKK